MGDDDITGGGVGDKFDDLKGAVERGGCDLAIPGG
jgi:hypothetical protein